MTKATRGVKRILLTLSFVLVGVSALPEDGFARGTRGGTRTSVSGGGGGGGAAARAPSGGGGGAARAPSSGSGGGDRNVDRSSDRSADRNVDRSSDRDVDRDVNRDVDRDFEGDIDVDVDHDYYDGWDNDWHPLGTAVAVTATAVAIGSIVNSIPPSCSTVVVEGISYSQCGNTWYAPRYSGTTMNYVVVGSPY